MNKRELISRVQRHMGVGASRDAARAAVNAVLESILLTAAAEGKIHLAHLGTFEYQQHLSRSGQGLPNATPSTPQAQRRLRFRPADLLRKSIEARPLPPQGKTTRPV